MRDPNRIKPMMRQVEALWLSYPDLRLSQLIANAAKFSNWSDSDIFYLEDDQLMDGLNKLSEVLVSE